jgi:hypothetical protein
MGFITLHRIGILYARNKNTLPISNSLSAKSAVWARNSLQLTISDGQTVLIHGLNKVVLTPVKK